MLCVNCILSYLQLMSKSLKQNLKFLCFLSRLNKTHTNSLASSHIFSQCFLFCDFIEPSAQNICVFSQVYLMIPQNEVNKNLFLWDKILPQFFYQVIWFGDFIYPQFKTIGDVCSYSNSCISSYETQKCPLLFCCSLSFLSLCWFTHDFTIPSTVMINARRRHAVRN